MPAYMKSPQKGCTAGELWIKVVLYIVKIFKYMHGLMHRTHGTPILPTYVLLSKYMLFVWILHVFLQEGMFMPFMPSVPVLPVNNVLV